MDQILHVSVSERDIYVHGGAFSSENESYSMISIGLPNWNTYFQKKLLSSSEKVGKSSKNAFEVAIPLYNFNEIEHFCFVTKKICSSLVRAHVLIKIVRVTCPAVGSKISFCVEKIM